MTMDGSAPSPTPVPAATVPALLTSATAPAPAVSSSFPQFAHLPTELRRYIWRASLGPRTVELHSGRYSSHYARLTPAPWHSSSGNPELLSVCAEARAEVLRAAYTVALPVAAPASLRGGYSDGGGKPLRLPDDERRLLYIDPAHDTVVILGELEYWRIKTLRAAIEAQDPRSLRRLALTTGGFARGLVGPEVRVWARTLLSQLEQFTLLLHDARWPPESLCSSKVVIMDCANEDNVYAEFVKSQGRHLRDGSAWMIVGERARPMRVGRVEFATRDAGRGRS
ncbi:hypothetical protein PG988_012598 [Apiospora saccharicola]